MKREAVTLLWLCCLIVTWALPAHSQQPAQTDQRVADFVREGKIRIGVFSFNTVCSRFQDR